MASDNDAPKVTTIAGVALFTIAGFVLLALLPWAEIGMPTGAHLPAVVIGPFNLDLNAVPVHGLYDASAGFLNGMLTKLKNDPNASFYAYSFFLGIALIAAPIGLSLVGREEAEEKTILPVKK